MNCYDGTWKEQTILILPKKCIHITKLNWIHVKSIKNELGLIGNNSGFIEWTEMPHSELMTTVQALLVRSYDNLAWIATKIGNEYDREKFRQWSDELSGNIRKYCWDDVKGAFYDGLEDGKAIKSYYPISSVWPAVFGITTHEQDVKINSYLDDVLKDIGDKYRDRLSTPYGGFYVLASLYKYGNSAMAEEYIRKYWSPMVLTIDDTAWENFDNRSHPYEQGTLSHAWSGGPTYYLTTRVLGVDLGFPDPVLQDKILITPESATLSWARGTIPLSTGNISVDWRISGDKLFVNCKIPSGIEWEVKPKGRLAEYELWVNNKRTHPKTK